MTNVGKMKDKLISSVQQWEAKLKTAARNSLIHSHASVRVFTTTLRLCSMFFF